MNRTLLSLLLFLALAFRLAAQEFVTHAVKEGETLYGIAKQYRVTPYNILKANKELKQDAPLRPNTILIIPMALVFAFGFVPDVGDFFTIISSLQTYPVSGTFEGLPEGATLVVDGVVVGHGHTSAIASPYE